MGRFLIVVGVLMLAAGVIAPIVGSFGFLSDIGGIQDVVTADTAELCRNGETLETESGPSSRTSTDGFGTGRNVRYFCVDATGERREVTEAFFSDMMTETSGIFGGVGSVITSGLAAMGLSMGGIVLIIAGVIMSVRGNSRVTRFSSSLTSANLRSGGNTPIGSSPFGNSPIGAPPVGTANPTQTPSNAGGMQGDVIDFVRDQLDTAYRNGQISREDYDRAVDKLKRQ